MVNIISGKDAITKTDDYDVVLVPTSIMCNLSDGFQRKIKIKYPFVDRINNKTPYGDERKLGTLEIIDGYPIIVLCFLTKKVKGKVCFIDYEVLKKCLITINNTFKGKKILSTVMGGTEFDGNGDKEHILEIFNTVLTDVDIDVYDYKQLPYKKEINYILNKINELKGVNDALYNEMNNKRNNLLKKLYLI